MHVKYKERNVSFLLLKNAKRFGEYILQYIAMTDEINEFA